MAARDHRPDFFIIGAVKSGTTALYTYLREHPAVFLAYPKDLNYFSEDLPGLREVRNEADYLRYFENVEDVRRAVGEASSLYLFSSVAVQRIHAFNSQARILALLRNPVDLVHAHHGQLVYSGQETEPDFEKAWKLQEVRAEGRAIPAGRRARQQLQYRKVAQLGTQLRRWLKVWPREQVFIRLFDDFVTDTQRVYEDALDFLNVPSDHRTEFPSVNESKRHRISVLGRLTESPPTIVRHGVRTVKRVFGVREFGVLNRVRAINEVAEKRAPLRPAFRAELVDEFREEIALLAELLDRDLSHWLRVEDEAATTTVDDQTAP